MLQKVTLCFTLILISIIFIPVISLGEETVDNLNQKINDYTQKIDELGKAKNTLSNQIKILDSQIELTLLKINQTELYIKTLESEIANLSNKISLLDVSLNRLSSLYIQQIISNYKMEKRFLPLTQFLFSNDFNSFLHQYKYLTNIQKYNQTQLLSLETVRTDYDFQKQQKENKQIELTSLEKKLSDQQKNLANQKKTKSNLLEITKNDETKYQSLKKAAEDELSSLLKAKFVGKRNVKKGEPLGLMGNTGYSFGDHLHFGLYRLEESQLAGWIYTNDVDPQNYLDTHQYPLNQPYTVTQTRGNTKYSYLYADHYHHGIDFYADNKTVMSVNEGVAYFYRNTTSSLGNHVKVFHPDSTMSLYLHLQ